MESESGLHAFKHHDLWGDFLQNFNNLNTHPPHRSWKKYFSLRPVTRQERRQRGGGGKYVYCHHKGDLEASRKRLEKKGHIFRDNYR